MATPFVSVLIDTYNHEKFIEQAVLSVLEQDFPASEREILVLDDGSTDRTPEILKKFGSKLRVLRKANGGQASAFNAGIPECRGAIVAFLDGDDWWAAEKLSVVAPQFNKHPQIATVGNAFSEVNETGEEISVVKPREEREIHLRERKDGRDLLPLRCFLGTSRVAIRTTLLRRVVPLPEKLMVEADEFMTTVSTALGGALVLSQTLTNYRLHPANLFQFSEWHDAKAERKYVSLECIVRELPSRLRSAGVRDEVIHVVIESVRLDADRLRLALGRGWPWETVRVEREAKRQACRDASLGYNLFHAAVLGAAAVLPPAAFYRVRNWYAAKGLKKVRSAIGPVGINASLAVRTPRTHG